MTHHAPYDPREILPKLSWITPSLAMGMRPDTYVGFDLVVSCENHLARQPMEGYSGLTLHLPMRDEDEFSLDAIEDHIVRAAGMVVGTLQTDGKVLVHCTGGLNRSGVVVAESLKVLLDIPSADAVRIMRMKRDKFVLCNRTFERWVTGQKLPTTETSMFRESN